MIAPSTPLSSEIVAVEAGPEGGALVSVAVEGRAEPLSLRFSSADAQTLGEAIVLVREGRVRRVTAKRGSARKDQQP